ncbi:zinc ribbon domain-containing protein [Bacillus cereus]|uniref:Zinc ribbon domain-containing protein n=1 Tax=Bacillus luti TaxID=2026191 RepID=A0ABU8HWX2_9BACI|nr:zinc ribbon domain-containing protein [Bacillus luti]RGN77220.1 zinc ribbon domain-containing protein [Bacillus cereus]
MVCNECGSARIENAKFCGECGSKFELPKEEILVTEQQKLLKMIEDEKDKLTDSILLKSYGDQNSLSKQYIQYINSVRTLLDFNEKNAEIITKLIMDNQDSDSFYAQLIAELKEENPNFIYQLDEFTAYYTLAEQKNDTFDFNGFFDKRHALLSSHIKSWNEQEKELNVDHSETIEGFNKSLDIVNFFMNLHENNKLIGLLKFRFKFTGGKHPRVTTDSETKIKTNTDVNTDNEHFKNDVIDLIDAALAFTSPVSATRYVLKKMKS